ncbi:hypothetical protein [Bradyrhizobium sp.]|uniref:hypothetical protein n=1 Tax=Bradyrhizobium sp. TaxID=376 RepID=UPI002DDCF57F|nr:hypothetical protein [Bradyrhizobium sp.]HEV2155404.1 hypothetical protein [Bradyrhizobium sp.]
MLNAERARQQGFDTEAKGLTDQSLGRYVNFDQQMASDKDRLKTLFTTPVNGVNTPTYNAAALPAASSDVVQREIDAKKSLASAYGADQADKLAQLRSFGDVIGTAGRGVADDASKVGQIGSFKKGSEAVTQLELDNANRAGNSYKFFGDILGGLGKVGLTAGLSPVLAGAGAGATTAAGAIPGAIGPTSVGGAPLVNNVFSGGATPFLTYGR